MGEAAGLGAAFLWACTSLLFTTAGRWVSPVATNLFKTLAATALFATILAIRHGLPFDPGLSSREVGLLALSGVFGLTLGDSFLYLGYQLIGPRRAMLVQSLHPFVGAMGAWLIWGEALSAWGWLGMLLALSGTAMVVADRIGALPVTDRRLVFRGIAFGLLAAAGQAAGALCAKEALLTADPFGATQVRVGAAALALVVFTVARGRTAAWARGLRQSRVLWRLSIASVLGPFLGVWLMAVALERAPLGIALTLLSMAPLWLIPLAAVFLRDRPHPREILGAVVAVGGVALLVLR